MPEGDTIHRAAARIAAALGDTTIERAEAPNPRSPARAWAKRLEGKRLVEASARGKHLFLDFEGVVVHSHLRMSGGWHVYPQGRRWRRPRAVAWLILEAGEVSVVQFNGPILELVSARRKAAMRLGPDPLADFFSAPDAAKVVRAAAAGRRLGEVLLDQRVIAGIGNVHKSEACFAARVDPWRPVAEIPIEELERVMESAVASMQAGLGRRRPRSVYGRKGRPCGVCGTAIEARRQGDDNRTTYWCPICQV